MEEIGMDTKNTGRRGRWPRNAELSAVTWTIDRPDL
jgi:hypothetical protein